MLVVLLVVLLQASEQVHKNTPACLKGVMSQVHERTTINLSSNETEETILEDVTQNEATIFVFAIRQLKWWE